MDLIIWIVVGAVAGILADWVIKGIRLGLLGKIIVGILGGMLGGWIFSLLGIGGAGFLWKVIAAFVGAVILLIVLKMLRGRR